VNNKVAFTLVTLIQILFGVDLENVITHLESDWLNLGGNLLAWHLNVAECFVRFAVEFWKGELPLTSNFIKYIWGDRQLRTTGVYDGRVCCILSGFLHRLGSVCHPLPLKSPCSKPVGEVLERFESLRSSNNLRRVVASEEGIRCLSHFLRGYAETDHSMVDDAVVFKRPKIMKFLLAHILVWRKTKNSI